MLKPLSLIGPENLLMEIHSFSIIIIGTRWRSEALPSTIIRGWPLNLCMSRMLLCGFPIWLSPTVFLHVAVAIRKPQWTDVENTKWLKNVKTVCGVFTHHYFNTKRYCCHDCKGSFLAWDEKTLLQDANKTAGMLNFWLSKGFAVHKELCSFIVTHTNDATASIHKRLKRELQKIGWMMRHFIVELCFLTASRSKVQNGRRVPINKCLTDILPHYALR